MDADFFKNGLKKVAFSNENGYVWTRPKFHSRYNPSLLLDSAIGLNNLTTNYTNNYTHADTELIIRHLRQTILYISKYKMVGILPIRIV